MEYNEDGKNDFICTNAVTYYIRDNSLHSVVQMRSNDVVFGYKNDYAWQLYVLEQMVSDYNDCKEDGTPELKVGDIIWQVQNLHVYERHFHLVK
jgi:thymidylate synthase